MHGAASSGPARPIPCGRFRRRNLIAPACECSPKDNQVTAKTSCARGSGPGPARGSRGYTAVMQRCNAEVPPRSSGGETPEPRGARGQGEGQAGREQAQPTVVPRPQWLRVTSRGRRKKTELFHSRLVSGGGGYAHAKAAIAFTVWVSIKALLAWARTACSRPWPFWLGLPRSRPFWLGREQRAKKTSSETGPKKTPADEEDPRARSGRRR